MAVDVEILRLIEQIHAVVKARIADVETLPTATQAQAEAGADNSAVMTPLRVKQAIDALGQGGGGAQSGYVISIINGN